MKLHWDARAIALTDEDIDAAASSAAGNPQGLTGTFSQGIISGIRPEGNALVGWIQSYKLPLLFPRGVVEVRY